ncbi:MAG: hypothetical protein PT957_02815 [Firmicutes bacterium]|nr:hypothetical protein [Bacillota bacterium]
MMKRFLSFFGQATILFFGLFLMTRIFPDSYGEIIESYACFLLPEFAGIRYFADNKSSFHEILPILGIVLFLNALLLILLFAAIPSSYEPTLGNMVVFLSLFLFPILMCLIYFVWKSKRVFNCDRGKKND